MSLALDTLLRGDYNGVLADLSQRTPLTPEIISGCQGSPPCKGPGPCASDKPRDGGTFCRHLQDDSGTERGPW